MSYFKLVAPSESPSRYTKVIRNPGADTKYNRQYQATDYVSRYTKSVAPPASYVPPGPDFEPLAVANNQGSNWVSSNVYEVGETIEAKTASYIGGLEPVTYRCRFQWKPKGTSTWVNGEWMDTDNVKTSFFFECNEEEDLKFQTQARDAQDPVVQLNSITGIKTVTAGDLSAPLSITKNCKWGSSNIYEVGQNIESYTATWAGGVEPITYRYRYQWKREPADPWSNSAWVDTTNGDNLISSPLTESGIIKFQCQAKDATPTLVSISGPSVYAPLYSVTSDKTIVGIGDITATVFGNPYDLVAAPPLTVLVQDPIPVAVQKTGSANVTYNWTVRAPAAAEFSNPIGASTDVTIATAGVATAQCTIQSLGEIETITIQFFGVATKEELNKLTN